VAYTLKTTGVQEVDIPSTSTQQVAVQSDGSIRVTVSRPAPPAGQQRPYGGKDEAAVAALEANAYIQSKDEKIVAAARKAVGSETDTAKAAARIATWVSEHITSKDLSVGYASASEVVRSRQGDCTEHSLLTAAMCRAAGIPARIALGMVYAPEWRGKESIFVGHQWTQVFIDGKWYDLDATRPPGFRDAQRITLAVSNGEMKDFFAMLANFNRFKIADVTVAK
jgi:transglutaminase-like putative cysteine protease